MSIKETRVRLWLITGNDVGNYLSTENPCGSVEPCLRLLRRGECKTGVAYKIVERMGEGWVDLGNIHITF